MALKAILASLEGVDDATKALYVEKDGKFVLDVEPVDGFSLEDVSGLKTALGKERTTREKLEKDVVKFKDLDPDKARTALLELEELKKLDPASEADKIANTKFEAAKAQLLQKHEGEMGEIKTRNGFLESQIGALLIDNAATLALAEAKGSVDLLLPHVRAHTRVKEIDGKFVVEVVDKDGNAKIADSKGTPMDIKGLVAEMRQSDTFGRAFEASGNTGTGKQPGNGGGGGQQKGNFGGTREERAAAIAAKFPDLNNAS
ncbi:hypothetical protein M8997_003995 [Phyllobacterium sp. 21LDTY02-6]|uniref:hypothetical protein n=1 Tax=Phyllobacterium sp. 21LDTY02-6 TaxID=2944903 RepID=UPI0020226A5E|nr:hypothetical protein [Phyllobacterium sp. 21LDTY02-6]MCO4316334.1 hypothetical protein [Phyllobacterium sp. 21LDTY02-6]